MIQLRLAGEREFNFEDAFVFFLLRFSFIAPETFYFSGEGLNLRLITDDPWQFSSAPYRPLYYFFFSLQFATQVTLNHDKKKFLYSMNYK